MNIRKLIGERLKEIRTALDLSQGDIAERTGISDETISRMERGVQSLTVDNLYKISSCLNVPLKDFFDIESKEGAIVEKAVINEVLEIIRHFDSNTVILAYRIIKTIEATNKEFQD